MREVNIDVFFLVQMREQLVAENRQKFEKVAKVILVFICKDMLAFAVQSLNQAPPAAVIFLYMKDLDYEVYHGI